MRKTALFNLLFVVIYSILFCLFAFSSWASPCPHTYWISLKPGVDYYLIIRPVLLDPFFATLFSSTGSRVPFTHNKRWKHINSIDQYLYCSNPYFHLEILYSNFFNYCIFRPSPDIYLRTRCFWNFELSTLFNPQCRLFRFSLLGVIATQFFFYSQVLLKFISLVRFFH